MGTGRILEREDFFLLLLISMIILKKKKQNFIRLNIFDDMMLYCICMLRDCGDDL